MIHEEIQGNFIYHYSDRDVQLHKVGTDEYYDSVYDIVGSTNQYEETDIPIVTEEEEINDAEHPTEIDPTEGEV